MKKTEDPRVTVLGELARAERPRTAAELAEGLPSPDLGEVEAALDALEAAGYCDRRRAGFRITPRGREAWRRIVVRGRAFSFWEAWRWLRLYAEEDSGEEH